MSIFRVLEKLEQAMHNSPKCWYWPSAVLVNRDKFLEVLDQTRASLPEEMKHARWVQKETKRLLDEAGEQAGIMVREAEARRTALLATLDEECRRLIAEAADRARAVTAEAQEQSRRLGAEAQEEARRLVESSEVLQQANAEAAAVMAAAESQTTRAVAQAQAQVEEITRRAEERARTLRQEADTDSREIRAGSDEYASKIFGGLSAELGRIQTILQQAQAKLGSNGASRTPPAG